MNILFLAIVIVVTFGIFGLPVWNLARFRGSKSHLWWIVPPALFLSLFAITNFFETTETIGLYKTLKPLGYIWLIVGMMLFAVTVVVMLAKRILRFNNKIALWLIIGATVAYATVAWINGSRIVVKELSLPAENITRTYNFVHITDLHSGSTDRAYAQRVVNKIKPLNPEFVVITGDFIDEFFVSTSDIIPFNDLTMPIYLITGNHEFYLEPWKINEVINGTNIQLIDGMKIPYEELDIVGVSELATVDATLDDLGGVNIDRYTILLDHQPHTDEAHRAEQSGVKLMLSGHTHKGQIWPMSWLVRLQFMYVGGLYEIGEMFLYVNQGTGTLGPRMRVGTVNEVTHITLEPLLNE